MQLQERMENLLIQTQKENQEKSEEKQREYQQKQLKYQKEMEQKQLKYQKKNGRETAWISKTSLERTSRRNSIENEFSFSKNPIWSAIENFSYSLKEDITFEWYFRRYEDLYKTDCGNWSDLKKIHLLLSKLGTTKHTKFVNYILPRKTSEFTEAVELPMKLFSLKTCFSQKMEIS